MHKNFADWLRAAGIEPNAETAPIQWKVISEYLPSKSEVVALARTFYGFSDQDDSSLDKFGTTLQDECPSFSMRDDKRLFAVLAGIELVSVIERNLDSSLSDIAALSLVCGAVQGIRTAIAVPEMPSIAARYLGERTSNRTSVASDSTADAASPQIARLERELAIVGEETNILWWLVSEFSRDENQLWKTVGLPVASIIAGKELADLTRITPGPVAASAFLDRIVRISVGSIEIAKAVTVREAIARTPRRWRERYPIAPESLRGIVPISNGIKGSLAVADGDDWTPVFEKATALDGESELPPNVLAYQVFLECLLTRLLQEA